MTDYPLEKREALVDLAQRGRARRYDPQVLVQEEVIRDGNRMVARVRATKQQGATPKFAVDDEVRANLTDFSEAYTVVLKLRSDGEWDTDTDDFYPIPVSSIKREARQAGAKQQVQINLGEYTRYRNDISRLFPDENGEGGNNRATERTADEDRPVGPDWSTATHQQKSLNKIAQDLGP
mgnify:CR=1 FL=1